MTDRNGAVLILHSSAGITNACRFNLMGHEIVPAHSLEDVRAALGSHEFVGAIMQGTVSCPYDGLILASLMKDREVPFGGRAIIGIAGTIREVEEFADFGIKATANHANACRLLTQALTPVPLV